MFWFNIHSVCDRSDRNYNKYKNNEVMMTINMEHSRKNIVHGRDFARQCECW